MGDTMGFSQRPRLSLGGFTIVELMTTMTICSMIGIVVVALFQAGMFQIRRSSGRIDLVRRARNCMDNTQRYLSAAVCPNESGADRAFCDPNPLTPGPDYYDDLHPDNKFSFVRFWTAVDFIGGTPTASARQLQTATNPAYYVYELAEVPGASGVGNDIVLRRYTDPVTPDTTEQPRVIARDLGELDESTGEYANAFVTKMLSPSAVLLEVTASGSRIHGELERHAASRGDLMTIRLTTIVQLPDYSSN